MNENPLISVIIPVYNVEQYIERCIRSVIVQTYKNLEIIIVDDGSTDNSGNICDKLAQEDNRIKVFHQVNKGVSAARNIGLQEAHGEFIGFVDSDDFIDSDMYEYLYSLIKDNGADISFCKFRHFDFPMHFDDFEEIGGFEVIDSTEGLKRIVYHKQGFKGSIWIGLYLKKVISQFPVGIHHYEDEEFKIKCFLKSRKIVSGKEIKYNYRYRDSSSMHSKDYEMLIKDSEFVAMEIIPILSQFGTQNLVKTFNKRMLRRYSHLLIKALKDDLSVYCFIKIKSIILSYAYTIYTERQLWKAKFISLLLSINNPYPYFIIIKISDSFLRIIYFFRHFARILYRKEKYE